jgi:hypothetical protein
MSSAAFPRFAGREHPTAQMLFGEIGLPEQAENTRSSGPVFFAGFRQSPSNCAAPSDSGIALSQLPEAARVEHRRAQPVEQTVRYRLHWPLAALTQLPDGHDVCLSCAGVTSSERTEPSTIGLDGIPRVPPG